MTDDSGLRYKIDSVMSAVGRPERMKGILASPLTPEEIEQYNAAYDEFLDEIGSVVRDIIYDQMDVDGIPGGKGLGQAIVEGLRKQGYELLAMDDA